MTFCALCTDEIQGPRAKCRPSLRGQYVAQEILYFSVQMRKNSLSR